MDPEADKPLVFISHSSNDKHRVRDLGARLNAAGVEVWLDEREMGGGEFLADSIAEGIYKSDFVAVVLSKSSVNRGWVKLEYNIALGREAEENRPIVIPLLLEAVEVPKALRGRVWIDMSSPAKLEAHLPKLLASVGLGARVGAPSDRRTAVLEVRNDLGGPILFLFARPCGTSDFGQDLLPPGPVDGTIQPGEARCVALPHPGCWDLRIQHLASTAPGQLYAKERFDLVVPEDGLCSWRVGG